MGNNKSIDGFRAPSGEPVAAPVNRSAAVSDDVTTASATEQPLGNTPSEATPQPVGDELSQTPPVTGGESPVSPDTKTEVELLRHKNKGLRVWLVVLLVLLTAVIVGFGVYFVQTSKAQKDLDAAQAQNQQLQQQIAEQSATQASKQISSLQTQVNDLTAQNKTLTSENQALTQQVKTLNAYIVQLTETANKLKTTCGTACSSITIPPAPSSSTSSTE